MVEARSSTQWLTANQQNDNAAGNARGKRGKGVYKDAQENYDCEYCYDG
jgi:hypothetical protein